MLAVTQSTPTHWVDRLASKPLGKFQFLLRRSKKPGKWPLLPFSSAQLFFSRLQSHFGWHSSSEVNWFIVITIVFQVGNQFCHFWTKEWRGDKKPNQNKFKQPNTPKPKPFPLDLFAVTFVSAPQKPLRSVKRLLGRHVLDGRDMKAKNLLDIMLVLSGTREGQTWCHLGFFVVFGFYLVSYCQNATAQKTKTAICISHGFYIL